MSSNDCVCRLCLRRDNNLESLLNEGGAGLASKAVIDLFSIKVDQNDGKPWKICDWCKEKLMDFYIFYLRVQNNEKQLSAGSSLLSPAKVKIEPSLIKTEPGTKPNQEAKSADKDDNDSDDDDIIFVGYGDTRPIDLEKEDTVEKVPEQPPDETDDGCSSDATDILDNTSVGHNDSIDGPEEFEEELEPGEVYGSQEPNLHSKIDIGEETKYSNIAYEAPTFSEETSFPEVLLDIHETKRSMSDTESTSSSAKPKSKKKSTKRKLDDSQDEDNEPKKFSADIPVPDFIVPTLNTFPEKLLCIKKNHERMTEEQIIQVFYGLKCQQCETPTDHETFQDLEKHSNEVHNAKVTLKCCEVSLIQALLIPHVKFHLGLGKISLKQHIRQLKTHFACIECGELFAKEYSLQNHTQAVHLKLQEGVQRKRQSLTNFANHSCQDCGKFFSDSRSLEMHKSIHTGDYGEVADQPKFACDLCDKSFLKPHLVKKHKDVVHFDQKNYSCHTCGKSFAYTISLQKHIREEHAMKRSLSTKKKIKQLRTRLPAYGDIECEVCGKPIKDRAKVKTHLTTHMSAEEREEYCAFECASCPKKFITKPDLAQHVKKVHLKAYHNFQCSKCDKKFDAPSTLKMHEVSHLPPEEREKLKTHGCQYCTKRFWFMSEMTTHIGKHHRCDICGELFRDNTLRDHKQEAHGIVMATPIQRIRQAAQLFTCEFCEKTFKHEDYYKGHLYEWHLGGHQFECQWCDSKFNYRNSFKDHCKRMHSQMLQPPSNEVN